MKNRTSFPETVQDEVVTKCRRRCALCFGLEYDAGVKKGQIAHIDRNPVNSTVENAAYLRLDHHNEYDGTPKQSKRFRPAELRAYQIMLYEAVPYFGEWPDARPKKQSKRGGRSGTVGVSLDVYDRRMPVYRTAMSFIRLVSGNLNPGIQDSLKFANDTDEALFLYDEPIAEYLPEFFRRALRLHTIELLRSRAEGEEFASLVKEETALALWFAEQPKEVRALFAPYLRLA